MFDDIDHERIDLQDARSLHLSLSAGPARAAQPSDRLLITGDDDLKRRLNDEDPDIYK